MAENRAAAIGGYHVEGELLEELDAAFTAWYRAHGVIWFDDDVRLANAIAAVLDTNLVWGEDGDDADE